MLGDPLKHVRENVQVPGLDSELATLEQPPNILKPAIFFLIPKWYLAPPLKKNASDKIHLSQGPLNGDG